MSDNQSLNNEAKDLTNDLGRIEIAPEVIEVIAGVAANEVEGIAKMKGTFTSDVAERLGKKKHNKGIHVEITDAGILIDVFCFVNFGVSIPTVAANIQQHIGQTLKDMTSLSTISINVHVVGIQFETNREETEMTNLK